MPPAHTLIIPALTAAPAPVPDAACPHLTALCRAAGTSRPAATGRHAAVWAALGGLGENPGAAAMSWLAVHGEPAGGSLLMATPVQMFAGPDQASMVPVANNGPEHQPALWIRLSQAVAECGGRLIAGPEGLVWLKLSGEAGAADPDDPAGSGGTDPFLAAGGPVDLPTFGPLLKLMNHLQMVLHAEADPGFNSLWFWGGGAPPDHRSGARGRVLIDGDAAERGMALTCGAAVADGWTGQPAAVLTDLRLQQAAGDPSAWVEGLVALDAQILGPFSDTGADLTLIDPQAGLRLEVVRSWWRRLLTRGGTPAALLGWPTT
jgi:hypothetical protein